MTLPSTLSTTISPSSLSLLPLLPTLPPAANNANIVAAAASHAFNGVATTISSIIVKRTKRKEASTNTTIDNNQTLNSKSPSASSSSSAAAASSNDQLATGATNNKPVMDYSEIIFKNAHNILYLQQEIREQNAEIASLKTTVNNLSEMLLKQDKTIKMLTELVGEIINTRQPLQATASAPAAASATSLPPPPQYVNYAPSSGYNPYSAAAALQTQQMSANMYAALQYPQSQQLTNSFSSGITQLPLTLASAYPQQPIPFSLPPIIPMPATQY